MPNTPSLGTSSRGERDEREPQRPSVAMERDREEHDRRKGKVHREDSGQRERPVSRLDHGEQQEEHSDGGGVDGEHQRHPPRSRSTPYRRSMPGL
jgi:hypothetical protein